MLSIAASAICFRDAIKSEAAILFLLLCTNHQSIQEVNQLREEGPTVTSELRNTSPQTWSDGAKSKKPVGRSVVTSTLLHYIADLATQEC